MAKQEKKTEIQKDAPAGAIAQFGKYAGKGFEKTTAADLTTPFIRQLQGLSPQITDGLEGAKLGMFVNTATGELIPMEKGILCVPIDKVHHYVEWRPRESGGGFVGTHTVNSPVVNAAIALNGGNKFGKLKTPAVDKDGQSTGFNELHESHDVFVMILNDAGNKPTGETAVFSFTSTKIKACRNWWTKMFTLKMPLQADGNPSPRPPLFAFRSRITGFKDPRTNKGVFFNVKVEPFVEGDWFASLLSESDPDQLKVLDTANAFQEAFGTGVVKPNYEQQSNPAAEDAAGEDVPF